MCYNIAYLERRLEKYCERYKNVLPSGRSNTNIGSELPVYYFLSGFTNPQLPIVKHDGIFLYEWGLIPFWVKDSRHAGEIRSMTLNAVGETVFEKPSFKKSIISNRCLLGVNGFFEWHTYNKKKYPFFIHSKGNDIFSLGSIYDSWTDRKTGEVKNTFSIITTQANPLVEKIHNIKKRMPLIIKKDDEPKWTDPGLDKSQVKALIKPYDDKDMTAYPVSRKVNYPGNERNIPEALERVDYNELSHIQG